MNVAAPSSDLPLLFRPKQRLGFNTRVSFNDDDGPAKGLRQGIELFRQAERLGYQSGWAYQRHFDHYLSSPLPFFAAVGQHTRHITLGSAVIPMRYQDPILLAEAAGTTDLLINGRLELAISTGANGAFDAVFGTVDTDARTEAKRRQSRFLAAIAGDVLHTVTERDTGAPPGAELRVTPHSPTLRSRIRQGSASIDSAIQAAELGIGLISGTVLHDQAEGETFGQYQARIIDAYRTHWLRIWKTTPPPVAVAASILVGTTPELREKYAAYDLERRTIGIAASRPKGALAPAGQPLGAQISPVFQGTPDAVIEAVLSDPGLAAADELVLFLPPAFGLSENIRLLADLATTVAPSLGWRPTGDHEEAGTAGDPGF
ncbi:LLM class flavin-dependent oxidoreductase [Agrobacterium tumefaciens]|uniref:LLM class flavin-dependent oxidoreductase n=1 Tax=Agrobacterium tumefaciens TaxID=358 RepID=UPI00157492D9|nr:LLM class flavin-dependent oxidoreductase [Agrobacterium tumefaciens]WCK05037.1 LLM class flavin-dependent oxidoreductase [Agrobacterium tumefaciens]